jgi:hypothetical protein
VWFRLVRFVMVSPEPRHARRRQAETPLIPVSRFSGPALKRADGHGVTIPLG